MKRSRVIGVGFGCAGACAALCTLLWLARTGSSANTGTLPPAPAPAAERQLLSMRELHAEGLAKTQPAGEPGTVASSEAGGALDRQLVDALSSDPELERFHRLRKKALRTAAEQQDYLDMIADETMLGAAREDLLAAAASLEVDQADELRRLLRIQYLNSALAWRDNPQRTEVIEAMSEILLFELPSAASKAAKGSVLGDKLDLFQTLMMSDRAHAEALLEQARSTRVEKVLQLAWDMVAAAERTSPR